MSDLANLTRYVRKGSFCKCHFCRMFQTCQRWQRALENSWHIVAIYKTPASVIKFK